ncbi:MAG TPA: hypothetical protein ENN68_03420 [Methanomicrobia archaeon]|mgnify:CR=1 FL=1|nr:hypothetical protein [Methanomicrobia archaeon]
MQLEAAPYEERITVWSFTVILGFVSAVFIAVVIYQVLIGPLGTNPAPNGFYLFMALLFFALAMMFSTLVVKLSPRSVVVSFGLIKRSIPWELIERCYVDEVTSLRYGGWGIRIGRVGGKWRLVFNIIGAPRVVLALKQGRFDEFVFSTRHPDEIVRMIRQRIGRME